MKTLSLIDASLFISGSTPEGLNSLQYKPTGRDLFRLRLGKLYNDDLNYSQDSDYAVYDYVTTSQDPIKDIVKFKADTGVSFFSGEQGQDTTVENNWKNSLNPSLVQPQNNPYNIIGTFPLNSRFFDHTITGFKVPSEKSDQETSAGSQGASPSIIGLDLKYNFYQKAYEYASTQLPVSESLLPSFYSFASILESEGVTERNELCDKHLTLNNHTGLNLDESITKLSPPPNTNLKPTIYFNEAGNYFDEYAYTANNINSEPQSFEEPGYRTLSDNFKNQIFQAHNIKKIFTDYNEKADNFPMYTKIEFSIDSNSRIANTINNSDLFSTLIKEVVQGNISSSTMPFNLSATEGVPFVPDSEYAGLSSPEELKVWDFGNWRENASRTILNQTTTDTSQYAIIGDVSDEYLLANKPESNTWDIETSFNDLNEAIEQISQRETRTYAQIIGGTKAYNETLFYKIEKWSLNDQNLPQELLQSFYMPNADDLDSYEFIDSQIKYGKKYIYRIYAFVLVLGSEYRYQLNKPGRPEGDGEVCVFLEQSEKLIQIPYFQKLITVADRPPVSPDIDIVPYYGVKNKLLFLLNGNVGNYTLQPIPILDQDELKFDQIRSMLGLEPGQRINFFSDDPNTVFEVFKLESRPTSYRDFAKGQRVEITAGEFESNPCKSAAAASLVDNVHPNKKYYYTFRAIDVHGNISNPSVVYELEISYDGASPFLVQNIIDFEPTKNPPQQSSRKFKKYIRIRPAFSQTRLNVEKSGLIDPNGNGISPLARANQTTNWIRLGTDDETLWGKTFKVRIVSRKTGREIDLNITFDLEQKVIQKSIDNKLC